MAFARISPLTLDGLPKYLSLCYHRLIEHAMYTFAELNLADRLVHARPDQGMTVQEIMDGERSCWDPNFIYRLLRTCIDADIVQRVNDDQHFVLTESGRMLTSDHSSHSRDFVRWVLGPLFNNSMYQLPDLVRHKGAGSGMTRVTGGLNLYAYISQPGNQELASIFNGAMIATSMSTGTKLVSGINYDRFTTLVDIGGGSGTYLAQILEHYPSISCGIVFDLPSVINQTKDSEGFKSRMIPETKVKFISGDMFDSSTIPQADAYLIKHIFHNYNDEKCVIILSSIRQTNQNRLGRQSIKVFIVDYIIFPGDALSNWQAHALDIGIGVFLEGGRERTIQEYEQIINKAGFKLEKIYPVQAPDSIIEAVLVD
ncbi:unnamed protein product [Rotaria sp. Silwood2]|nr:unnamed protein product [Rotaria sp. Silwood2]CAF4502772.1 unnamed protein product [Rotaria sp. Silwood2]CAF4550909.1 unnamed protein product [Rotaria sp. Silwood2]